MNQMNQVSQTKPTAKRLLVMAGGTGGHIFPALVVANALQKQGWQVCWLGTRDRMEAQLIPQYGIPIEYIKMLGIRGKGIKRLIAAPFLILRAIWQAYRVIKRFSPDAVLGMGSYIAAPGGIAAKLAGVPLIIHEQNGKAGLTNTFLSIFANRVLQAFPNTIKNAESVGNPIRQSIAEIATPISRFAGRKGPLRIVVLGGSQGSGIINRVVPQALSLLNIEYHVVHQVGKNSLPSTESTYQQLGLSNYDLLEFIDEIEEMYAWGDVVICRSGALTISELTAVGLSGIFVPFPHKDRQQYWNALPLQQRQAGVIIEERDFSAIKLAEELQIRDRTAWFEMAQRAHELANVNAAQQVANIVIDTVTHCKK